MVSKSKGIKQKRGVAHLPAAHSAPAAFSKQKGIKQARGGGCLRLLKPASVGLIVVCGALYALGAWAAKQEELLGPTRTVEAQTEVVLNAFASETQTILNDYATATQAIVNQQETQIKIAEATQNAATYNAQTATATMWTKIPTATITNTPLPTATPLPTNTPAPASANISVRPINRTYYIQGDANVRPCPQMNDSCTVADQLPEGTSITVNGETNGDAFRGSTLWYRFERNGRTLFIHSELVSSSPPVQAQSVNSSNSGQNQAAPPPVASGCSCTSGDTLNCNRQSFSSVSQAQACYDKCMSEVGHDVHDLDRNHDGRACENGW